MGRGIEQLGNTPIVNIDEQIRDADFSGLGRRLGLEADLIYRYKDRLDSIERDIKRLGSRLYVLYNHAFPDQLISREDAEAAIFSRLERFASKGRTVSEADEKMDTVMSGLILDIRKDLSIVSTDFYSADVIDNSLCEKYVKRESNPIYEAILEYLPEDAALVTARYDEIRKMRKAKKIDVIESRRMIQEMVGPLRPKVEEAIRATGKSFDWEEIANELEACRSMRVKDDFFKESMRQDSDAVWAEDFLVQQDENVEAIYGPRVNELTELITMRKNLEDILLKYISPEIVRVDRDIKNEPGSAVDNDLISIVTREEMDKLKAGFEGDPAAFVELEELVKQVTNELQENADNIEKLYKELFPNKKFNKIRAIEMMGSKAIAPLTGAAWKMRSEDIDKAGRQQVFEEILEGIKREKKVLGNMIVELEESVKRLDKLCGEISPDFDSDIFTDVMGNPDKYKTPKELNDAISMGEIKAWWMDMTPLNERFRSFDVELLDRFIDSLEKSIERKKIEFRSYFEMEQRSDFAFADPTDKKTLERIKNDIENRRMTIDKIKNLRSLRAALEEFLDKNVFSPDKRDEKYDAEKTVSQAVFNKYQEIIDQAKKSKSEIKKLFKGDREISDAEMDKMTAALLAKAKNLLDKNIERLTSGNAINEQEIMDELDSYKADLLLTASVWQAADKTNLDLSDLKSMSFEKRSKGKEKQHPLSIDEQSQMLAIVKQNYAEVFKDNPQARERVIKDFEAQLMSQGDEEIYIMKHENEVVAFARYIRVSDTEVKGASFNVLSGLKKMSLGAEFLKVVEGEVGKTYDIRIKSRKDNPANALYQRNGYEVIGEHKEEEGTEYFDMLKPSPARAYKLAA